MHNKATDKKPDVSELRADRSDVMVNVAKARACPAPSLLSPPVQPGDALFSGTHTNKTYLKSPAAACQIVCHRSTFSKVMTHHHSKSPLCTREFCQRDLEVNPGHQGTPEMCANLLLERGEVEKAQHCLGRAITVQPNSGFSKYLRQ